MPTVFRVEGFRFVIYPNDHAPAHVHVVHADGTMVVNLLDLKLRESRMPPRRVTRGWEIVAANRGEFLDRWSEIHG